MEEFSGFNLTSDLNKSDNVDTLSSIVNFKFEPNSHLLNGFYEAIEKGIIKL